MRAVLAEPLELRLRALPWLAAWAGLLAAVTAGALVLAGLPAVVKVLLACAVALRLAAGLSRTMSGAGRVLRATLTHGARWQLEIEDGTRVAAELERCWGLLHGPVIGLAWTCDDGKRRQVWLSRREADPADWRRLRARLALT